jgi:hypothetical protein
MSATGKVFIYDTTSRPDAGLENPAPLCQNTPL